ncbi:hypothetical protein [Aquabacterium sp. CECT 9606]|jgi:hypothetical protein|uniref:hypothetical protein n=1 Tax=Aquabacterium sp. CECT 9606 TaxID=2845822 RepID=UPI001E610FCF|nr:hypothetical protein [Aquabacterium sp. CECT 9606]CAH0349116.1 hypothetical protein AQB9606_00909 [Aquabacterium sp. CECT 9606]
MKHVHHRLAAGVLFGLAAISSAMAVDGVETFTSGGSFFKRVVTNTNPQTTSTTVFQDLPSAGTTIFVPPQTSVLVSARFDAEARCSNTGSTAQDWCEAQILIGGVEGSPQASTFGPDTYALKSTNAGAETTASWAAQSFSRHRCIRNTSTAPMAVNVKVQWKVTNFGGAAVPDFWVDDSALAIDMSRDCTVSTPTIPSTFGAAAAKATNASDAQSTAR